MKIKRTEYKGIAEDVTILYGEDAERAVVRIAKYHEVQADVIRGELARGVRVSTCGAFSSRE